MATECTLQTHSHTCTHTHEHRRLRSTGCFRCLRSSCFRRSPEIAAEHDVGRQGAHLHNQRANLVGELSLPRDAVCHHPLRDSKVKRGEVQSDTPGYCAVCPSVRSSVPQCDAGLRRRLSSTAVHLGCIGIAHHFQVTHGSSSGLLSRRTSLEEKQPWSKLAFSVSQRWPRNTHAHTHTPQAEKNTLSTLSCGVTQVTVEDSRAPDSRAPV